jgi:hypothetical protein
LYRNALVSNERILEYKHYLDDMRARERIATEEGAEFRLTSKQLKVIRRA